MNKKILHLVPFRLIFCMVNIFFCLNIVLFWNHKGIPLIELSLFAYLIGYLAHVHVCVCYNYSTIPVEVLFVNDMQ